MFECYTLFPGFPSLLMYITLKRMMRVIFLGELLLLNHSLVRLPSHQTIPIHSPSNLSGRLGFGFVISRTNKPRFASRLHTSRNQFIPSSFSFTRDSAGQENWRGTKQLGEQLKEKWHQLRSNYMREKRSKKHKPSGSGAKAKST
ncbi:hypothetical protein TNCT_108051 [Trichonephila clavata]|uniref:Uncharacterized protein n=1 Tax=Trichonephila clavata TaxID=2740835 RepID=A0A8X6HHV3_TRICU|nr:hypothetical protein TNCT_108051 [Trichonephila clavata]